MSVSEQLTPSQERVNGDKGEESAVSPSQQNQPNEGLEKLEDPAKSSPYVLDSPPKESTVSDYSHAGGSDAPLGSFVATMEEQTDKEKLWYEVVETRASDDSSVPVGLFSDLEEAKMAMAKGAEPE